MVALTLISPEAVLRQLSEAKDGYLIGGAFLILAGTLWIACGVILGNHDTEVLATASTINHGEQTDEKSVLPHRGQPHKTEKRIKELEGQLAIVSGAAKDASHNVFVGGLYLIAGTIVSLLPLFNETSWVGRYVLPAVAVEKPVCDNSHEKREADCEKHVVDAPQDLKKP
jgi:hypothetical protein